MDLPEEVSSPVIPTMIRALSSSFCLSKLDSQGNTEITPYRRTTHSTKPTRVGTASCPSVDHLVLIVV
jgi:hypothetical protein